MLGKWEADPFAASISLMAEFLTFFFRVKQLATGTLAGNHPAISSTFKHLGLLHVDHDPSLTPLLASFSGEHPKTPRLLPQWDLSLVLTALARTPFQPLQLAAPKFLAWKVFFLLCWPLASGARRGKRHAVMTRHSHDDKWKSVTMFSHPGFISKTQLCTKGALAFQKLVIPVLLPLLGLNMSEDWFLCPVQAIKVYLAKTEDKPKDKELLFISYKEGCKGDLHTITPWVDQETDSPCLQHSRKGSAAPSKCQDS